jgi:hypothetical protein
MPEAAYKANLAPNQCWNCERFVTVGYNTQVIFKCECGCEWSSNPSSSSGYEHGTVSYLNQYRAWPLIDHSVEHVPSPA